MAIPTLIKQMAHKIRNEIKGIDVRESLAKGIEEAGNIADESKQFSEESKRIIEIYKKQFDEAIKKGDQVVEVQTLRVDPITGEVHNTAADRFKANQLRTKEQLMDISVNVKDFGAKLDGITNDTEAFKKAIIFLNSIGGGTLLIPNGVLLINGGGNSLDDFTGMNMEYIHKITIEGVGASSEIRLKQQSVYWGTITKIRFKKVKFTTDKRFITDSDIYTSPTWVFSNFYNVNFEDCTFDDWGIFSQNKADGEVLTFAAFERSINYLYGKKIGDSDKVKIINCDFIGGVEQESKERSRDTQFAIRFYTEFILDDGTYKLERTIKDMTVDNCTFTGFNWQAVEFAGAGTKSGIVSNCQFYDCGITWAEADKGAKSIKFIDCLVNGLHGSYEGDLPRGVSIQGSIHPETGFIVLSENITVQNIEVKNIKSRGDGIHLGWIRNCVVKDIDVESTKRYAHSMAIRIKQTLYNCTVKDIKLNNFYYGFYEDLQRTSSYDMGTFENIDMGQLEGFIFSLCEGQMNTEQTTYNLYATFKEITATTTLKATSESYVEDPINPSGVQMKSNASGGDIQFIGCDLSYTGDNTNIALIYSTIRKVRFINCKTNGFRKFSNKKNELSRLVLEDNESSLFHLQNVMPTLSNNCYIYPKNNSADGFLYSNKKPSADTFFLSSTKTINTEASVGDYVGWIYLDDHQWHGFGMIA